MKLLALFSCLFLSVFFVSAEEPKLPHASNPAAALCIKIVKAITPAKQIKVDALQNTSDRIVLAYVCEQGSNGFGKCYFQAYLKPKQIAYFAPAADHWYEVKSAWFYHE